MPQVIISNRPFRYTMQYEKEPALEASHPLLTVIIAVLIPIDRDRQLGGSFEIP